jgi:hypothetical protein
MENKYKIPILFEDYQKYLSTVKNGVFRTLCLYEEGKDWQKSLESIKIELTGAYEVFNRKEILIRAIVKLESLNNITEIEVFRKIIFETLTLLDQEVKEWDG